MVAMTTIGVFVAMVFITFGVLIWHYETVKNGFEEELFYSADFERRLIANRDVTYVLALIQTEKGLRNVCMDLGRKSMKAHDLMPKYCKHRLERYCNAIINQYDNPNTDTQPPRSED